MNFEKFIDLLTLSIPIVLFIGILRSLLFYKLLDKAHKILLFYLIICFLTDISSRLYGHFYKNNLVFIVLFGLLELVIFSLLYQIVYFDKKNRPLCVISFLGAVFILWELLHINTSSIHQFQSYSRVVDCSIIVGSALMLLFEKIKQNEGPNLLLIRLNSVILIYFSTNLLLLLPINFLINTSSELKFYLWFANLILTTLFYFFLIGEIWKNGQNLKQSQSGL